MDTADTRYRKLIKEALQTAASIDGQDVNEFQQDLGVVTAMVKEGYPLMDIVSALRKSLAVRQEKNGQEQDVKAANIYANKILTKLNDALRKESRNDFQEAREAMKKYLAADQNRYKDYAEGKPFGLNRKVGIVLALLVKEGFSKKVVEAVLSKTNTLPMSSPEEANALVEQCGKVAEQYQGIRAIPLATKAREPKEIYMQYAKEYMSDTGAVLLNRRDEEKIMANMYKELVELYKKQLPNTKEGNNQLEKIIKEDLKPFLYKSLRDGSPTANEPGRDKEQYVQAVMQGAEYIRMKLSPAEEYEKTQKGYLDLLEAFKAEREERRRQNPASIYDAALAKKLLDDQNDEKMILRAIMENSPIAQSPQNPKGDGQAREYAAWILEGAKESIHREKEIVYHERQNIPKGMNYQQLQEAGFSAHDLYIDALQKRMDEYPTFRMQLSDPSADIDAMVKLIHQYPDCDRTALKEALNEFSPRKAMPGVPEEYAELVLEKVQEQLGIVKKRNEKSQQIQNLFNLSRGFATDGIYDENPMNTYKDGKVAVQMLQRNFSVDDIRQLLLKVIPDDLQIQPDLYASAIINQARIVLERTKEIEEYRPKVDEPIKDAKDIYLEEAQKRFKPKGFPDTAMDIGIYTLMRLANIPEDDIHESIREYSPNIEEPGREPDNYVQFVKTSADRQIEEEKKKLAEYRIIPRSFAEDDLENEYAYQKQQLTDYIGIPCEQDIDAKIAAFMLDQGKEEQAIQAAIEKNTSQMSLSGSYSAEVLQAAKAQVKTATEAKNINIQVPEQKREAPQRVRSRTDGEPKANNNEEKNGTE